MFTKVIVIVVLCMATVNCFDVCANNDDKCVENKIKEYVDNADQEGSIPLFGGLSIDKVRGVEPLPSSNDESLVGRVQRYMQSHELKFQVPEEKKGRSLTEGKWYKSGNILHFEQTFFYICNMYNKKQSWL